MQTFLVGLIVFAAAFAALALGIARGKRCLNCSCQAAREIMKRCRQPSCRDALDPLSDDRNESSTGR
jgi:hypothetical protein